VIKKYGVATCSGATNWEAAFVAAILLLHPAYWKNGKRSAKLKMQTFLFNYLHRK